MTTAPSPTWQRVHLRSAGLRDLLDAVDARLASGAPADAVRVETVPAGYADLDDLLVQVYGTWIRRLQARLEQTCELDIAPEEASAAEATAAAWAATARDLPGVRALLDTYADRPALQRLRASEESWMALAAAVAGPGAGAALIATARARASESGPTAERACLRRASLRERLGRELRTLRIA